MSNELVFIENEKVITDSLMIAEMFGKRHDVVLRDIRTQIEYAGEEFSLHNFEESNYQNRGKQYPKYKLTEEAFTLVVFSYNTKEAVQTKIKFIQEFKRMRDYIEKQHQTSNNDSRVAFEMQMIGVEYASKILRVDETSKVRMLEEAHKAHGVPTNHLPKYIEDEVTKSLTTLIKEYNVNMSTAKVNTRLIELGILEIKERPSSSGAIKEFKSLTENGLKYGKNLINARSPKETQPHYYESKFKELLDLICK